MAAYDRAMLKEIQHIDTLSTAKVAAVLGVLWAVLGWIFSGIILSIAPANPDVTVQMPTAFSIAALLSGVIGGAVGGGLSGFLGSYVYNLVIPRLGGGIIVALEDVTKAAPASTSTAH